MVLSYYFLKIPYSLAWYFKRWAGTTPSVVFYCGTALDLTIFEPVQKYLKPLPIVVKNKELQAQLKAQGIDSTLLPCFPRGVLMVRHAAYKFPVARIRKVCLSHGAYNFKRFASAKSHNLLDAYLFTSRQDVENARAAGITTGRAVGYPKLDRAFNGEINAAELSRLRSSLFLKEDRKSLLFTATWDKSGISAIGLWYQRLKELTKIYNVLVTVHPWTSKHLTDAIRATPGVMMINGYDVLPYIMLADLCIGDTSSIIGECCALDKPIITFKVDENQRSVAEITAMIQSISWQVDDFDELVAKIPEALENPLHHQQERKAANTMMFDDLDGQAGKRAADVILDYFPDLALD